MRKTGPSFEKRLRFHDKTLLDLIEQVKKQNNPQYPNYNTIMEESIRFGLPHILEDVVPQNTIGNKLDNTADRIIKHINRKSDYIQKTLTKILISSIFSQEVLTVLINETEMILKENQVEITPKIRERLRSSLPEPFESELNNLIERFEKDENKN